MLHHYQLIAGTAVHHIHAHWHVIDTGRRRIRFYRYDGPDSDLIADLPWLPPAEQDWTGPNGVARDGSPVLDGPPPNLPRRRRRRPSPWRWLVPRRLRLILALLIILPALSQCAPAGDNPVRATQIAWWGLGILGLLSSWASYRYGLGTGYDQGWADANKAWLGQQRSRRRRLNGSHTNGSHLQPIRPRLTTIDRRLP